MLKIVDVHVGTSARGEYVVLQNQGLTTVGLRGWALCGDAYLEADPSAASRQMYIFADDEQIKPYQRVVLFTGEGVNGWRPTNDGKLAYLVFFFDRTASGRTVSTCIFCASRHRGAWWRHGKWNPTRFGARYSPAQPLTPRRPTRFGGLQRDQGTLDRQAYRLTTHSGDSR